MTKAENAVLRLAYRLFKQHGENPKIDLPYQSTGFSNGEVRAALESLVCDGYLTLISPAISSARIELTGLGINHCSEMFE